MNAPDATGSRAQRALALVLAGAENTMGSGLRVLDSWVESDDTFCLVFTSDFTGEDRGVRGPVRLRRVVDSGWTVEQVAEYVLVSELGEPLGSLADELEFLDGVWWFTGDHDEWKEPLS
ncbi:hypothetical protein ACFQ0K_16360 [Nocardioides caeni]|uniref:Uncharacterized protein n=1 Tax=Nocardioides caeni TaxID=574700 RepID=A0A4S8NJJ4_9ACTN|nr:hypothetical protein [Nocardioides caeni]THV16102.1 hypothetical protein E9934_07155 [Nocardioides caeni]